MSYQIPPKDGLQIQFSQIDRAFDYYKTDADNPCAEESVINNIDAEVKKLRKEGAAELLICLYSYIKGYILISDFLADKQKRAIISLFE